MNRIFKKSLYFLILMQCLLAVFLFPVKVSADNIEEAQTILPGQKVKSQITKKDKNRYYKIHLPGEGRLQLEGVTGSLTRLGVVLYDENYEQIQGDTLKAPGVSLNFTGNYSYELSSGTYYLRFNGEYWYTGTRYFGEFEFTPRFTDAKVKDKGTKNTFTAAAVIPLESQGIRGHLALNDGVDYYKLTLPASGICTISAVSWMKYLGIQLFDWEYNHLKGDTVQQSEDSSTGVMSLQYPLMAGTYYFRIAGNRWNNPSGSNTGNYMLQTSFKKSQVNHEESNLNLSLASAVSLQKTVYGLFALNHPVDFYQFSLDQSSLIRIKLVSSLESLGAEVIDFGGRRISGKTLKGGQQEAAFSLEKGRYYLKLVGNSWMEEESKRYGEYSFLIERSDLPSKVIKTGFTFSTVKQQAYTGKDIRPTIQVYNKSKLLNAGSDYSIVYSNNIKPGKAAIKIQGKGNYSFNKTINFIIAPARTVLREVTSSKKKSVSVKYDKVPDVSGYQILYSYSKNSGFKSFGYTRLQNKTITGLNAERNCYVKVRAYKTVSKQKVYGPYSAVKSCKVRKK